MYLCYPLSSVLPWLQQCFNGKGLHIDTNKCAVCGKAVYAMERLEADKIVYHKACFKCSSCQTTLR